MTRPMPAPRASRRILYAGDIHILPARLRDGLSGLDCFVVYSPVGLARTLIRSDIKYSLLLFDDTAAGRELERFTRSLTHRAQTPIVLIKKAQGVNSIVDALARLLRG